MRAITFYMLSYSHKYIVNLIVVREYHIKQAPMLAMTFNDNYLHITMVQNFRR